MNIFDELTSYGNGYSVKSRRHFNDAEVNFVTSAKVVKSNFGMSVCFFMRDGGQKYIPVSINTTTSIGTPVDVRKVEVLELVKEGSNKIYRVEF